MLGKRVSHRVDGNKIEITFEHGTAVLSVLREDILNVFVPRETKEHRSKAIEGEKCVPVEFTVTEEAEALVIKTPALWAKVYDGFFVDFYKKDGTLLCADSRQGRIFGSQLSEKFISFLEAEGHDVPDASDFHYPDISRSLFRSVSPMEPRRSWTAPSLWK